MRVGIMQPYFFPYVGYFQLIAKTDQWIVFDDVQYIHHGWMNRNRILHPIQGWQYIIVPLASHSHKDLIKEIRINHSTNWKERIISQLGHYKKRAPYYNLTIDIVKEALNIDTTSIVRLNTNCLSLVCSYLGLPFHYQVSSECSFDYQEVRGAGDWALAIASQLGATEYINPIGGRELFDESLFRKKGIKLSFLSSNNTISYSQGPRPMEPLLSIIDMMMFCSVKEISELLQDCEVTNYGEERNRRFL